MIGSQTATTRLSRPEPGNPAINLAAEWLAAGNADSAAAILPQLRDRFDLSVKDAIEACRQAALIRAKAYR